MSDLDKPVSTEEVLAALEGAALLTSDDKDLAVGVNTAGDNAATGLTITNNPVGYVRVLVGGVGANLGDAVKTKDCYFSADGGTTAKAISAIVATDELIWNGVIAGANLLTTNRVDFDYMAV